MTAPPSGGTPRIDEAHDDLVQQFVVASWTETQSDVRIPSPRRTDPLTEARHHLSASLTGPDPQPGDLVRDTPAAKRDTSAPAAHPSNMDRAATDPAPSQTDDGEPSRIMIV